ncbi:MAG: quinonprotein alcohol dehydrogenase, partial [Acidobacteria bacterium]|nr:quinonprotein alcohol dehydrogenase [Acidobacteriota bacterium]
MARLPGGVSSRATPVVDDGVLYLSGGANVFAIDGRTGETIWRWQPGSSAAEEQRVPSWQGVGLGDGRVFVPLRSAEGAALRQDTG